MSDGHVKRRFEFDDDPPKPKVSAEESKSNAAVALRPINFSSAISDKFRSIVGMLLAHAPGEMQEEIIEMCETNNRFQRDRLLQLVLTRMRVHGLEIEEVMMPNTNVGFVKNTVRIVLKKHGNILATMTATK